MNNNQPKITSFNFDNNGNIFPYSIINISLEKFKEEFVIGFSSSKTRANIFNGYTNYLKDFHNAIGSSWTQWIDGSFTTNKIDPSDVDLVNLVDINILNSKVPEVRRFLTKYGSKKNYVVDGYIIPIADVNDKRYPATEAAIKYWKTWFGKDRASNPKGLIEIEINSMSLNNLI
jgi:hypothetical protein